MIMNRKKAVGCALLTLFLVSCGGQSRIYSSSQSSSFVVATYNISYILNGGNNDVDNPATYSNDGEKFVLQSPYRENYDFKRWMKGNDVVTEIDPSWNQDVTLEAIWSPHPYQIHYIVGNGTNNPNNPSTYTVESFDIDLLDPTFAGSSFLGWYDNAHFQGDRIYSIERGSKGDIVLYARYAQSNYIINYILNGGVNNPDNPLSYNNDDEVSFLEPTRDGYEFLGWFDVDGNPISGIPEGSDGSIIVEAKWREQKHTITLQPRAEGLGTCSIVSGEGYTDEMITVEVTDLGDNTFAGWYEEDGKVSDKLQYQFKMPPHDITLTAMIFTPEEEMWPTLHGIVPVLNEEGDTIHYGLYPQRPVTDADLITALNGLSDEAKGPNGWYLYENEYYAPVVASPIIDYGTKEPARFDDETIIDSGITYWFRCDRLAWRVLAHEDSGAYLVMSKEILEPSVYDGRDDGSSNYITSEVRSFVTGSFFSSAFGLDSQHLLGTDLDKDNKDFVILPTLDQITNVDWGFEDLATGSSPEATDPYKTLPTGEWGRARGVAFHSAARRHNQGGYWTRTGAENYGPDYVWTADYGGITGGKRDYANHGIAPLIRVVLDVQ